MSDPITETPPNPSPPKPTLAPALAPAPAPAPVPAPAPADTSTLAPTHPRSLRKRLVAQQHPTRGVRSLPLPVRPVVPEPPPPLVEEPVRPRGPWRWTPVVALIAVAAWIAAALTLTTGLANALPSLGSPRQIVVGAWLGAALLSFAPLQWRLGLGGLAWQGAFGWTLLGYLLAFTPPPTGELVELPDLPVYLLLFLALFYAVASAFFPVAFLVGQRLFSSRLQRLDVRRARRQGYEAGLFIVGLLALSGLRVLTIWTGLLLLIVVVLLETLLISQVPPEG